MSLVSVKVSHFLGHWKVLAFQNLVLEGNTSIRVILFVSHVYP